MIVGYMNQAHDQDQATRNRCSSTSTSSRQRKQTDPVESRSSSCVVWLPITSCWWYKKWHCPRTCVYPHPTRACCAITRPSCTVCSDYAMSTRSVIWYSLRLSTWPSLTCTRDPSRICDSCWSSLNQSTISSQTLMGSFYFMQELNAFQKGVSNEAKVSFTKGWKWSTLWIWLGSHRALKFGWVTSSPVLKIKCIWLHLHYS